MKRISLSFWYIYILAIIFSITLSSVVLAENDEPKTISVVMDDNYPPYSFRDSSGNLQGITIDQWKLFEKKTGIKVEITGMEWNKAYQSMLDGKFDVVDTISYNSEREKILDYTEPYATIDVPIFFHENISGITEIESLKGFTVAAKKSDNAINELRKNGITSIQVYDTAEAVVQAAKDQEIVIFVMGKPPSLYYMYKMGIQDKFKYSASLYTSKFYRAVNEGNKELLDTLNHGFAKITKKEYKEIENKWYGTTDPLINNLELLRISVIVIIVIVLITLFLLLWNRTLQLKVKQKTKELFSTIEELKTSEERLRALLEAIPDMFFLFNRDGNIIDYHTIQETQFYIAAENFLSKNINEIFPEDICRIYSSAIDKALTTQKTQTIEYTIEVDSYRYGYEARLVACGKDRVVGIIRDITDRKKSEEKLLEISIHDSLTGLHNRYYFEEQLVKILEKEKTSIFVAMLDLDGLKLINDTMGHTMGDQYLITAAKILLDSFPTHSIISRIGGDEFCVIILNAVKQEINDYIKRLNEKIDEYSYINSIIQVSISFGYVFNEQHNSNVYEVIKEADNRMYRVKLHRRQSMKSEVVQTMKNMLEARDFITEGHANRMEDLAVGLSLAIGIPEKDIADIRLLAQFHDIGKVGIPDHILFKPSKLSDEEFEIMKRHTEIGHRIAESSVDLLPIADFILKHHEYWDGRGYPFGLKGEEIPIECRILTIVDAYDAMTNDRPYRKALSKETAIEELKRCSGTQFDPILVEEFIKMIS